MLFYLQFALVLSGMVVGWLMLFLVIAAWHWLSTPVVLALASIVLALVLLRPKTVEFSMAMRTSREVTASLFNILGFGLLVATWEFHRTPLSGHTRVWLRFDHYDRLLAARKEFAI